jgi:multiple sugar transport system permease protein
MFTRDFRYWRSVKVTFFYVFTAIPLRLIFALLVAMLLNTQRRMVAIYRALYYAPSVVGASVAVAVMWREVFGKEGLVNYLLAIIGIPGPTWLGDPKLAIWTLITLAAWQFGSPMLIFLAGLKQIPTELYEACSIDGASRWSRFVHVTLPMITPVILFNMVMQMISGFLIFAQAFIVSNGRGLPMDSLLVYALYLYQQAFVNFKMGYSSAMAWVLLLVIAIFTVLVFKSSQYWVFYESEGGE